MYTYIKGLLFSSMDIMNVTSFSAISREQDQDYNYTVGTFGVYLLLSSDNKVNQELAPTLSRR